MTRHSGHVTWFNPGEGYGFLKCSHAADVFVDAHEIEEQSRYFLKKGDRVLFDIVETNVGHTARAVVRMGSWKSHTTIQKRCYFNWEAA